MRKTNDTYLVTIRGRRFRERYLRDPDGWVKVSSRDRRFRMTAEQVLNHLLPALAFGPALGLTVTVEHAERPWHELEADAAAAGPEDGPPEPA